MEHPHHDTHRALRRRRAWWRSSPPRARPPACSPGRRSSGPARRSGGPTADGWGGSPTWDPAPVSTHCALAAAFPEATVTAVNGSPSMRAAAARRADAAGLAVRVHTADVELDGTLTALGPLDLAWAALSLHHARDATATLRARRRAAARRWGPVRARTPHPAAAAARRRARPAGHLGPRRTRRSRRGTDGSARPATTTGTSTGSRVRWRRRAWTSPTRRHARGHHDPAGLTGPRAAGDAPRAAGPAGPRRRPRTPADVAALEAPGALGPARPLGGHGDHHAAARGRHGRGARAGRSGALDQLDAVAVGVADEADARAAGPRRVGRASRA